MTPKKYIKFKVGKNSEDRLNASSKKRKKLNRNISHGKFVCEILI